MALDLVDYEQKARAAVKAFWGNRAAARRKQVESGKPDQGERAGVTAGLRTFVAALAGHVAAEAARLG